MEFSPCVPIELNITRKARNIFYLVQKCNHKKCNAKMQSYLVQKCNNSKNNWLRLKSYNHLTDVFSSLKIY